MIATDKRTQQNTAQQIGPIYIINEVGEATQRKNRNSKAETLFPSPPTPPPPASVLLLSAFLRGSFGVGPLAAIVYPLGLPRDATFADVGVALRVVSIGRVLPPRDDLRVVLSGRRARALPVAALLAVSAHVAACCVLWFVASSLLIVVENGADRE